MFTEEAVPGEVTAVSTSFRDAADDDLVAEAMAAIGRGDAAGGDRLRHYAVAGARLALLKRRIGAGSWKSYCKQHLTISRVMAGHYIALAEAYPDYAAAVERAGRQKLKIPEGVKTIPKFVARYRAAQDRLDGKIVTPPPEPPKVRPTLAKKIDDAVREATAEIETQADESRQEADVLRRALEAAEARIAELEAMLGLDGAESLGEAAVPPGVEVIQSKAPAKAPRLKRDGTPWAVRGKAAAPATPAAPDTPIEATVIEQPGEAEAAQADRHDPPQSRAISWGLASSRHWSAQGSWICGASSK